MSKHYQNGHAKSDAVTQNGHAGLQNGHAKHQNGHAKHQNGHANLQNGHASPQNGSASPPKTPTPPAYWKTLLAAAPLTGLAFHNCWSRLILSGTLQHLLDECKTHSIHNGPLRYSFLLDRILCANTNFVAAALDPSNPPYAPGYLASFATCAFIPLIEASRVGAKHRLIKNPLLFGISGQLFGRGVVYPGWWATFVSSGSGRKEPADSEGSEISQYDAEANLFALLLCILTPTSSLSIMKSRPWMTTWFVYPVTALLIRKLYKWVRERVSGPPKDIAESNNLGFYLTMGTYLIGFFSSATLHLGVMTPCMWHPSQLKLLLEPSLTIIGTDKLSVAKNAYRIVQWDAIIVFTSSLLATLTLARTKTEAAKIAVLDFLGVLLFGSGASLSGVWAWREYRLKQDREALALKNPSIEEKN